jgi:phospholipid/cholesterol/gamma-HCH transport system substrate-binding protein
MAREQTGRIVAFGALAVAVIVIVLVLAGGGSSYVLYANFADAGQLVSGDLVTIAGHDVGTVGSIGLSGNGLARIELDISDSSIAPLRTGTVATIGQLSLTGVANRFVGLDPGPGQPIASGGTLQSDQTHGIVDLDTVLDALTPQVRDSLQRILKTGAYFVGQPTISDLNQLALYLNPAFSQATALGGELVADRGALSSLISSTGQLTAKLATNAGNLGGAVSNTANALRQVASERAALADTLTRAPAVLQQARTVLAHTDTTLGVVNPMLTALEPVAPRLATLLRQVVPFGQNLVPTLNEIHALFPSAETALHRFVPVEKKGVPALKSLATALNKLLPILSGIRPYAPDLTAGFFNGVGGSAFGGYDANGHYLRARLILQGGGTSLTGLLSILGNATLKLPGLSGGRTRLFSPCPGGGGPPSPDKTAPWLNPDTLPGVGILCNPSDDQLP